MADIQPFPVVFPMLSKRHLEVTLVILHRQNNQVNCGELSHRLEPLGYNRGLHSPFGTLEMLWQEIAGAYVVGRVAAVPGAASGSPAVDVNQKSLKENDSFQRP